MCNQNCNQGRSCTCSHWRRTMRMIIGKKPPPAPRDNQGKVIHAGPLVFSPDFPENWLPSKWKLEKAMDKVKLRVIKYHDFESVVTWEKNT